MMAGSVIVLFDEVFAKIPIKISPHGVNMIGIVLRIVEFDQKGFPLDSIIMRLAQFGLASPSKSYLTEFFFLETIHSFCGKVCGHG